MSSSLSDTALYKVFKNKIKSEEDYGNRYLADVESICSTAITLSDDTILIFCYFTLHNHVHIYNVLDNIAYLLGKEGLEKLNTDMAAMLMLAACWHDIGMCVSKSQREFLISSESESLWDEYLIMG